MTKSAWETAIAAWDGKSAADIRAIHETFYPRQDYTDSLLDLLQKGQYANGVTWLLKAAVEADFRPSQQQAVVVYGSLESLDDWEAVMHILQCMEFIPVPGRQKKAVHKLLKQYLRHKNKFLRAWSYSGFYFLAKAHPGYRSEAVELFELAQRHEAASVQARVRKVAKRGY